MFPDLIPSASSQTLVFESAEKVPYWNIRRIGERRERPDEPLETTQVAQPRIFGIAPDIQKPVLIHLDQMSCIPVMADAFEVILVSLRC